MNTLIIVGGGIAGLTAAYELSKLNYRVTLLEAKDRLGGRIHTATDASFSQPVEFGAEFVHGNLPNTLALLREAGIPYHPISDKMIRRQNGQWKSQDDFTDHWDELMHKMKNLETDITLSDFLEKNFAAERYQSLRSSVIDFAGGFDLADAKTASVKSLFREWSEEMEDQYRPEGGYRSLLKYLERECKAKGCVIERDFMVEKIDWKKNSVTVFAKEARSFTAGKVIIAVPVSVLQANAGAKDFIEFSPSIPTHIDAAKNIGFGPVIKVLVEFSENFWTKQTKGAGFFLSQEVIPTWWTQSTKMNNLLTGWVGGEKARVLAAKNDEEVLSLALQSLANIFDLPLQDLRKKLKAHAIVNWTRESYINGGYSFNMVPSDQAKTVLRHPIDDTLFFTGEALFDDTPGGTVEAAIKSARDTVSQIVAAPL